MTTNEAKAESGKAESGNARRRLFPLSAFRLPLLFLLVFAAYWPALRGEFVWDDELLVLKNPLATGQLNLRNVWLQTDFSLTTVTLWLQWLLWGNHPACYHIVNVLLHALSCVLLWRVLLRLRIPGAWLAAAIFAVHPVVAASVAWISEMKNTLSLVFCLTSFWLFLSFEERTVAGKNKAGLSYLLSLGAFLLALLSKTSTVMLPVVLVLCAWWRRGEVTRRDWLRLAPFFALSLLLGCATIWFQHRVIIAGDPVQTENICGRFAAAGQATWFYLGKVFLPFNLSMIYPRWTMDQTAVLAYLPAVSWLAVLALLWKFRHRVWGRAALFGLGCFTVTLFPVLGFLSMDYLVISRVSDHFQYLPMIAIVVLFAAGLSRWLPAQMFMPATTIVLLLSFATFQRAEIIARDETLWRDTLEKNPDSFTAHNNLGCLLARQNKMPAAIQEFEATLRLRSQNAPAHCNLGRAYAMQGDFVRAESHFQSALKIKPDDAEIQQAYALALLQQGKVEAAIEHLRLAVRVEPKIESRQHLAGLLHQTGQHREAIAQYREVLKREPDSMETLNNLAWMLATSPDATVRNGAEAVNFAEHACRLTDSKKAGMVGTLAAAYAEAGRFAEAVTTATKAAELADAAGDAPFAAANRQLLSLYRAGRPYHEAPAR